MQQAQINLLADMGAQPATRDTALSPASASSDTAGPAVTISSPAEGATIPHGTAVTVSGTASDTGGIVAGVEVSTDGGTSWHPAQGRQNWTYTYIQKGLATASIKVRAVDDSANIGARLTRNLQLTGPYSVFGQQVPDVPDSQDGGAYELGLNITPSVDGFITGARFYKSAANTGTHTGSLWSATGPAAGDGHVYVGNGVRLAGSALQPAGGGERRAEVRRLLHRSERSLRQQGLPVGQLRPDRRAPDRCRRLREHSGRCVCRTGFVPDEQLQQRQLLRGCPVRHG